MSTWPPFDPRKKKMTTPHKNRLEAAGFLDSSSSRKLDPNSILGSWERLRHFGGGCSFWLVSASATLLPGIPPFQGMSGSNCSFSTHPPYKNWSAQDLIEEQYKKKPTHHPSKTYKDTQDTLLDSTFLRSFLSLQLYPCFAAHMWITHTMVVRLGISEVAVCYL